MFVSPVHWAHGVCVAMAFIIVYWPRSWRLCDHDVCVATVMCVSAFAEWGSERVEEATPPLEGAEVLEVLQGWKRGIQGHLNSCYLDASLFRYHPPLSIIHSPLHPPSIHLSGHSSIHLFSHPSIILSLHSSIHPSVHPSIYLFIHPSIHLFIHPSIQPSVCSSIHLSICSSIHPSIC